MFVALDICGSFYSTVTEKHELNTTDYTKLYSEILQKISSEKYCIK